VSLKSLDDKRQRRVNFHTVGDGSERIALVPNHADGSVACVLNCADNSDVYWMRRATPDPSGRSPSSAMPTIRRP
jgi:hypothetical protein